MAWTLAIDLAGRYSAAVLLNPDSEVKGEWCGDFGARTTHPSVHIRTAGLWFSAVLYDVIEELEHSPVPPHIWVEDVPAQGMAIKPAMQALSVTLAVLGIAEVTPGIVMSGIWQKALGCPTGRSLARKQWAKAWALEQGYEAPKGLTAKQREDLTDAYCLARYGQLFPDYVPQNVVGLNTLPSGRIKREKVTDSNGG